MRQVIIDSEAEIELSDSVAFYERKELGLGLEFARAAREAVPGDSGGPGSLSIARERRETAGNGTFPFCDPLREFARHNMGSCLRAHEPQAGLLAATALNRCGAGIFLFPSLSGSRLERTCPGGLLLPLPFYSPLRSSFAALRLCVRFSPAFPPTRTAGAPVASQNLPR